MAVSFATPTPSYDIPAGWTVRDGVVYDAQGGYRGPIPEAGVAGVAARTALAAPKYGAIDADDWARQTKGLRKELAINMGVGLAAQGAQSLASLIPTAQDRENRERLGELREMRDQDRLGLSPAERTLMERTQLDPVRALAREQRLREEDRAGASGGRDVASLTRATREERRNVNEAARRAGESISRANLERAEELLAELDRRTAYKSQRQGERIGAVTEAIGEGAGLVGQVMAGNASVTRADIDWYREVFPDAAQGKTDAEIRDLLAAARRDPTFRDNMGERVDARESVLTGTVP